MQRRVCGGRVVAALYNQNLTTYSSDMQALTDNEATIVEELLGAEGKPSDLGGYFHPDQSKVDAVMRPSATLNSIIDSI